MARDFTGSHLRAPTLHQEVLGTLGQPSLPHSLQLCLCHGAGEVPQGVLRAAGGHRAVLRDRGEVRGPGPRGGGASLPRVLPPLGRGLTQPHALALRSGPRGHILQEKSTVRWWRRELQRSWTCPLPAPHLRRPGRGPRGAASLPSEAWGGQGVRLLVCLAQ